MKSALRCINDTPLGLYVAQTQVEELLVIFHVAHWPLPAGKKKINLQCNVSALPVLIMLCSDHQSGVVWPFIDLHSKTYRERRLLSHFWACHPWCSKIGGTRMHFPCQIGCNALFRFNQSCWKICLASQDISGTASIDISQVLSSHQKMCRQGTKKQQSLPLRHQIEESSLFPIQHSGRFYLLAILSPARMKDVDVALL